MSGPEVVITRHAIQRFIKRHAPHMDALQAGAHLVQAATTAAHLKEKTTLGQDQWQIEDPPCTLVMKKEQRKVICVTVLPEPEIPEPVSSHGLVSKRQRRRSR